MKEGRLLERLAGDRETQRKLTPQAQLLASVAAHLRQLFSTRAGYVLIDAQYGLPDLRRLLSKVGTGQPRELEQLLVGVLERFEPRLQQIKVRHLGAAPDGISQRLEIEGVAVGRTCQAPFVMRPLVGADGRFDFSVD